MAEPTILTIAHYDGGWLGIAVFTHDGERYQLTETTSHLAAELFDVADALPGRKDKRREVTDVTLTNVQEAISTAILTHAVERVIVEIPPKKGEVLNRVFAITLEQVAVFSLTPELISCKWRIEYGNGTARLNNIRTKITESLGPQWVDAAKYQVCQFAVGLGVYMLYGAPEVVAETIRKPREIVIPVPVAVPVAATESDEPDTEERCAALAPVQPVESPRSMPDPVGPVTAGIDPGSRFVALAIGEGDGAPLILRHLKTYEVGETIERKTPKIIEYASGAKHVLKTRRVMTSRSIDAAADAILADMLRHKVTRLVIEHIFDAHISGEQSAAVSAIATALIHTMWVATEIACRARAAGIEVVRVRASTWRSRVAGKGPNGGDGAERIPTAVAAGFVNWVSDSIDHERDAAGILLFGVIPEEVTQPKVEHKPKKKRARTPEEKAAQKEKSFAARMEKRAAFGCSCPGKKHVGSCPLYGLAPKLVLKRDEVEKREAAGCQCVGKYHKKNCPLRAGNESQTNGQLSIGLNSTPINLDQPAEGDPA